MPELPEVESTVKALERDLLGLEINDVTATWARMIEPYTQTQLQKNLKRRKILAVSRRAKFIVIEVEGSKEAQYLLLHLRMSGRIAVSSVHDKPGNYDRVVLSFTDGTQCRFIDTRKFGRFTLMGRAELQTKLDSLGPEPLSPSFKAKDLHKILLPRNRILKPLLLDQSVLAGLGNIYVDESLWASKLHPTRKSNSVTAPEAGALYRSIRRILKQAIELNGTDFGDGVVHNGKFSPKAYGRAGEPCLECGQVLERLIVGQRGTVVCSRCQR